MMLRQKDNLSKIFPRYPSQVLPGALPLLPFSFLIIHSAFETIEEYKFIPHVSFWLSMSSQCFQNVRYAKLFSLCDKYDRMTNEAYFFCLLMLNFPFSFGRQAAKVIWLVWKVIDFQVALLLSKVNDLQPTAYVYRCFRETKCSYAVSIRTALEPLI